MSSTTRSFPLTTVEQRFWMLHLMHPDAPVANIGRVVELKGDLWPDDMVRAFGIVAQNPVLRMRVREERGVPVGHLGKAPTLEVDPDIADDAAVAAAVEAVVKAPYDLEAGPLVRARLLKRGEDDHLLVLGAHHLILDGWGLSRSLPRALARALRGQEMSFGDEAALDDDTWIDARIVLGTGDPPAANHDSDKAWWQQRLANASTLTLPTVTQPPPQPSGRAWDVEIPLPRELFTRAEALASAVGARAVHVFLAAFAVEMSRAARTRDILIGTTSASRPANSTDSHEMGCFVRTKALRVAFPAGASFKDVIVASRGSVRDSLAPGAFDAEELPTIGAPALGALFNYIPFPAFDGEVAGLRIDAGRIISGGTAFPISLTIDEKGQVPRLVIEVDADVFDEGFAARLAERIKSVLEDGLKHPDLPHERLNRLGAADRAAFIATNQSSMQPGSMLGGHLGRALEADLAASHLADKPALVWIQNATNAATDRVVGRPDLLRRVRAVARSLRQQGVGPGDFVGVSCTSPLSTIEAIFGVLFAGAAYVPIDPAAPPRRREAIVDQARLSMVLDDNEVDVRVAACCADLDDSGFDIPGTGSDPAYAIFTSGSTGTPKGVVVSHDAVMCQQQARDALGFPHVDRSLLLAPFFFDGSVETVFWSLTTGGSMHVLDEQARRDPVLIRQAIHHRRITYTSAVPALWSAILDACPATAEPMHSLEFVIVGGERLTTQLIDKHHAHCGAMLVNEYGPTESTVFSTAWVVPGADHPTEHRVPIGHSAPHVHCCVVDEQLEPVPVLEPGELVVSGPGLADGYLNSPELTAQAFVSHDLVDGSGGPRRSTRLYRTGDIVRLWPDGQLEWLARKDDQVKLRGLRVEPGEVEGAIMAEGASECAVVVDGQHLIAYVSPASINEATLIAALLKRLPEAMVPARVVAIAALPKTANDKIDKRALPRVVVDDVFTAPDTSTERMVASVWADVLGRNDISVTRSFFAYGGHSLKAAVVVRRLSDQLGIEVALSALMAARTVRELARTIDARRAGASMDSTGTLLLPLTSRGGQRPDVIFLPGIGGHVFTFAPIADLMHSSGIGLRTFGSESGETPFASIEALAGHNLAALDDAKVPDDVVFAGYSFGGLVAYEMALQRSALGRPPRQLVIFDTMAPGYPKKLPAWTRARMHAETLASRDWRGRVDYLKQRAANLKESLNHRFQRADAFADVFADAFALNAEQQAALPQQQRAQLERLAGVSTVAHHSYWPRASTAVPLLLFAAEHRFTWDATRNDDPLLGWQAWSTGPVERVELGGDHLQLFQADNLDLAAATLDLLVGRYRR